MRANSFTSFLFKFGLVASILLLAGPASAQQVNLTAGPVTATLPDGTAVPMWGYGCGAAATGSTATCAPFNPKASLDPTVWSPVVITVPYVGTTTSLTINLTNNLSFTATTPTGTTTNNVPTSLFIAGQLGGGLGTSATYAPSPTHAVQGATWPIAGDTNGATFNPPAQGPRVQSFGTEAVVGVTPTATTAQCPTAAGATTPPAGCAALTWAGLHPGTYLIESGTHPSIQGPMGLYGILIVTTAPSPATATTAATPGTAYPGVSYAAEVPLLFSEIDPTQNNAVQTAVSTAGFSETSARVLRDSVSSVTLAVDANGNVINAGSGYVGGATVTFSPTTACVVQPVAVVGTVSSTGAIQTVTVTNSGQGCTEVPTATAAGGNGLAQLTAALSLAGTMCSDGAAACYPPAVNYTPLYYLVNGVSFDRTNPAGSLYVASAGVDPITNLPVATGITGNVLVRLVNAGLRMHVPAIVGSQTTGTAGAVPGLALIAEDGNVLPGVPRVQSEVFMAAGKTMDVMINAPQAGGATPPPALPIFDRELSLSGNAVNRDAGMLAYIGVNGGSPPTGASSIGPAVARADTYNAVITCTATPCIPITVTDPGKGVIANDTNVYGVRVLAAPTGGKVVLNLDGTFTYTPNVGTSSDSFTYCANGSVNAAVTPATCSSGVSAKVTLGAATIESGSGITMGAATYTSRNGPKPGAPAHLLVTPPGVLAYDSDHAGYPLTVDTTSISAVSGPTGGATVTLHADGSIDAAATTAGTYTLTYKAKNSQGTPSTNTALVTLIFPTANGPTVTVLDGATKDTTHPITDYRWIIEEDRTFYVDPKCTTNPLPAGCPAVNTQGTPPVFGTNFHTSYMPLVATGCTGQLSCESGQQMVDNNGQHIPVVCDVGNGVCRPGAQETPVDPSQVALDPTKRYYISILPGDAANPFIAGYAGQPDCSAGNCGHGMGGAPLAAGQSAVTILTQPSPYPPATLTVFVFEDDFPLNGEHDAGGGVDVLAANEQGLGGFQITLFDDAGGTGDPTGQPTYDMFNMPLSNSLAGTIDPVTGLDACPISPVITQNATQAGLSTTLDHCAANPSLKGCQKGITGMIVTCPKYESDGQTLSPLAGQAVVKNLYQGRYGVMASPNADRIARGEEWLQTNTLDGQKAHDSFMRIGEPAYFQEFGPAGYHVTIGFANPKIINDRRSNSGGTGMCDQGPKGGNLTCNNTVRGHVTTARMSRPPDQRLYGSGTRDSFAFTQCYASLGDPDGADFAFAKCKTDTSGVACTAPNTPAGCNPNNGNEGYFEFTGIPAGNWKITVFDQWNDQIVDGIMQSVGLGCSSTAAGLCPPASTTGATVFDFGEVATHQWQANIYTRSFIDSNGNGLSDKDGAGNDTELGLALASTNIRFRDGSFSNFNNTDLNGYAGFNEVFPLFNWYVIETDTTNYKSTGVHVVHDAGGPTDGSTPGGTPCAGTTCGNSTIAQFYANTLDTSPLPPDLRNPGAVYCAGADCLGKSINPGLTGGNSSNTSDPVTCTPGAGGVGVTCSSFSTGRIDPPYWFGSYGWQGFSGQNSFLEFGKRPFIAGENGGIHGHVVYASTRPFDDPQLLLQTSWEPLVPHVRINLYMEGLADDGVTPTLKLIDYTETSSFDDWVQGFRLDANGKPTGTPNISCPGQTVTDPFFYALQNQPQYLDFYASQHSGAAVTQLPYNAQFKCYDGMHNWNQLQPAPYDGMYSFPSVTRFDAAGKPAGTHCTACSTNPDSSDPYRFGTPMLPAGKYVVEVVVPQGYELVKEEDKNILIGDNFIAPAVQQFAALGNIFILPDQAELSAFYNANNPQNPTNTLGRMNGLPSHEGDTGSVETFWPCVGAMRTVPDYISLFPQSAEVSPFAGAVRPLCDRKEVTLTDQSSALAKFYVFTSTHAASHFTGVVTDDFTAEFDPFSPQFGEKFAPANLPVSVKDWAGNEISRIYADQFGAYNGLSYSTWEVNPPNPTGYGPTMMVVCMNDSGSGTQSPAWDPKAIGVTSTLADPLYQAGYSQFCYELPFMPGQTGYFDTPVTPTSAFSEGYNHPDCNYPDATPAIASVVSSRVPGPWVGAAGPQGDTLTITALGDVQVDNYGYTGPQATTHPFNDKKVTRHYGFGPAPTATNGASAALVASDGTTVPLIINSWLDGQIVAHVPTAVVQNPHFPCPVQQQAQYGGPNGTTVPSARCGQLVITAASGKTSIDTVTVTVGGKAPTVLAAGQKIQPAIDAAKPGDMIIVPPGVYNEMLLMWKPIRLQGVGAATTIIDANAHPAGKLLTPWRVQVNCLFGLTPDGRPRDPGDPSCSSGWFGATNSSAFPTMIVDRLPFEAVLGWDATLNGNLAEQLIEPSLMGAYEGAAITVLGKGIQFPAGTTLNDAFGATVGAAFPANTALLDGSASTTTGCGPNTVTAQNPYPGNYYCNPSSIDGLGVRNSSQGGGGILVHAYAHNIQIANNRVHNNTGTMTGGITVGMGEHPDVNLGGGAAPTTFPGSCETSPNTVGLPLCFDMNVYVHHNSVTQNSSMGDELFSATPAGGGGVTLCTGSDYYRFNYNWVCGNISTGDGGGVVHLGFSKNGDVEHNTILFNQSTNPTITTNGGGLLVMGAPDVDPTCGANTDQDCVPNPSTVTPSDGTGPNLVINANLILGNSADSGSGGGLRMQHVNGNDVLNNPLGGSNSVCSSANSTLAGCLWNTVIVQNNIIANNVAGWDGGGVSLFDALAVNIVNNTIASNDSTASAGVLFGSLFAPQASSPGTNCTNGANSCPQVAGVVSLLNSPILAANLPAGAGFSCPSGHGTSGSCRYYSVPLLYNDVIWDNRTFNVGVGGFGSGNQSQQKTVSLYNSFSGTPGTLAASQTFTGQCPAAGTTGVHYWDLGVRGDLNPGAHVVVPGVNVTLTQVPSFSVLTSTTGGYGGNGNVTGDPLFVSQYCNGSRVPPETCNGAPNLVTCLQNMGWQVPPGTNETNALPTPVFSLTATATVDEGNNWINMRWGPLSLTNPSVQGADGNWGGGAPLGNYGIVSGSSAIGRIPSTATVAYALAPNSDFFGTIARKSNNAVDAGAVEFAGGGATALSAAVSPTTLAFGNQRTGTVSAARTVTVTNTGNVALAGGTFTFGGGTPQPFARATAAQGGAGTCGTALAVGASCTINVVFRPPTATSFTRTLSIAFGGGATVTGTPVTLTGTGI